MQRQELPPKLRAKGRSFEMSNGDTFYIERLPTWDLDGVFWSIEYERRANLDKPQIVRVPVGGDTLREVFGKLRLQLAIEENPKLKEVTEKMQPQKTRAFHLASDSHGPVMVSVDGIELIEGEDYTRRGREILIK